MASLEMGVDLSTLVDILVTGDREHIVAAARTHLQDDEAADVLIGRIGMLAAHGDSDGHTILTLTAAAMLCRYVQTIPLPIDNAAHNGNSHTSERTLPLFVQALLAAAPAVRAGRTAQSAQVQPLFPSGLSDGKTVNDLMHDAIYNNDAQLAERLLLGLYGTGADYRTMQVRAYDGISATFHDDGHPLLFTVRGFQLLDTVEWGDRVPNIIHWLAPHLPLSTTSNEPDWVKTLRAFVTDPTHAVSSIRTRLSPPQNANALPLRQLILSNADTAQVCQGVYDALMKGEASPRAIGSVIALAAADVIQKVGDEDRALFLHVAHGLLFAAAVRLVFQQVQDVEVLALLFTAAAYINALQKEAAVQQPSSPPQQAPTSHDTVMGGGLIAVSQLDTLSRQLAAQERTGAFKTAQRYLKLGYDVRALFATIGLAAVSATASSDLGHTLQLVQAAAEEYIAWPDQLSDTNIEAFLHVALRATAFAKAKPAV